VSSYLRPHLTLAPSPYPADDYAPEVYAADTYADTYADDYADPYGNSYAPYSYQPAAPAPVEQSEYAPGDESWRQEALCAETDPEAFFPEKGGSTREAKKICTGCEVKGECLEYALEHDERFGIWGGLSERERRRLKRRAV
jgi:WhiB family transcriptional regulator, redox-sensing transcriptional regulator